MTFVRLLFASILVVMVSVTAWASFDSNVWLGVGEVWRVPWARATLFDAYAGFLAIFAWIAWREPRALARVSWFVLLMALGNIAVAAYVLIESWRLPKAAGVRELLLRREG
jgi:hypothetical protein